MKQILLVLLFMLMISFLPAQNSRRSLLYDFIIEKQQQGTQFTTENILDTVNTRFITGGSTVMRHTALAINKIVINDITNNAPDGIRILIPVGPGQDYVLLLALTPINNSGDFSFGTIDRNISTKTSGDQGVHYRGYIVGDTASIACISFFKNGEVMAVFANREGNFILGKMKTGGDKYVVYKSSDMLIQPRYQCGSDKLIYPSPVVNAGQAPTAHVSSVPPVLCKKVRFYWEGDYHLYNYNFANNLINVQNYLTGLFNVVATLYQNEGIIVELSKSYVWTSTDPYSNTTSNDGLNTFKSHWNGLGDNFDGDLAHLIAGGTTNNGGVAFILNFDQCNRPYAYGYSNVYGTFQQYPNYTWDAQVVTHETGHNFGSNHTHWCGWNTGPANSCGAIDNCAAFDAGSSCTTCPSTYNINTLPPGFTGTIMSYCYLKNGIGVDFVNGFGPLPQAVIRNNVTAAACFTSRNNWTGAISKAWENTGNWSCGKVPDGNTDVVIKSGLSNYPVINSAATCRSMKENPGANIKVNNNFQLTITGKPN